MSHRTIQIKLAIFNKAELDILHRSKLCLINMTIATFPSVLLNALLKQFQEFSKNADVAIEYISLQKMLEIILTQIYGLDFVRTLFNFPLIVDY